MSANAEWKMVTVLCWVVVGLIVFSCAPGIPPRLAADTHPAHHDHQHK